MNIKVLLWAVAVVFAASACARIKVSTDPVPVEAKPEVLATPTGPCRDDENFENGRCVPRIQRGN